MFGAIIGAANAAVQAQLEYDFARYQYMQQTVADKHIDVPALIPQPQTTGNAMFDALMTNLHENDSGTA